MKINPIRTDKQYQMYLREIKRLEAYQDDKLGRKFPDFKDRNIKKLDLFRLAVANYK